ncbi:hypothetical protein M569_16620, partial [Genlisea aurea]
ILFVTLFLASTLAVHADLIDNVCKTTVKPRFCETELRSNPRSRGANLSLLGQIAIAKASVATKSAIAAANAAKNKKNAEIIDTCVETFGDAIDNLKECKVLIKTHGAKNDLQTKASAAYTDAGTCDDEFGDSEPANLKAASQRAQDLISVLLAVAN